jgi:hypothetical protein
MSRCVLPMDGGVIVAQENDVEEAE